VAEDLGVKPEPVLEMESRLSGQDLCFDPAVNEDDDEAQPYAPAAYLSDAAADPALRLEQDDWQDRSSGSLREALAELDERSRVIVESRWLTESKTTLHELAARFDVSAERIRQLEKNAIDKLKKVMAA
jgi:RNA polymerase sigma-32 factor